MTATTDVSMTNPLRAAVSAIFVVENESLNKNNSQINYGISLWQEFSTKVKAFILVVKWQMSDKSRIHLCSKLN